jgi:hypothetical protein
LKKEIEKQLAAFKADLQKDGRPAVQPILQALAQIDTSRLEEAAATLDALRRQYVRLLADELSTRLSSTPPLGVDRDWPAILSTLTAGLAHARTAPTAEEAAEAFRASLTLFLNTALTGFRSHLENRVAKSNKPAEYKPVQDLAAEVASLIAAGDLMTAWQKLSKAETDYRQIIMDTTGNLGADATGLDALRTMSSPAASAAQTWDISSIFGFGRSSDELQRAGSMVTIDEAIHRSDMIFTIVILVLAVLSGFKTLWADNLTWGGLVAYLTAILWGVGFDQFSHAGLAALVKKR